MIRSYRTVYSLVTRLAFLRLIEIRSNYISKNPQLTLLLFIKYNRYNPIVLDMRLWRRHYLICGLSFLVLSFVPWFLLLNQGVRRCSWWKLLCACLVVFFLLESFEGLLDHLISQSFFPQKDALLDIGYFLNILALKKDGCDRDEFFSLL